MCDHVNRQAVAFAFDLKAGSWICLNLIGVEAESASTPGPIRTAHTMIGIGEINLF